MLYYKVGKKAYALQCFGHALKLRPENLKLKAWVDQYKASGAGK